MIAPPVAGTCSDPRTSNRKRNSRKITSAKRMTNRYGRSRGGGLGPNRSRRTTSRQLAMYMGRNLARGAGSRPGSGVRLPRGDGDRGSDDGREVAAGLPVDAALQVRSRAATEDRREPVGDPGLVAGVGQGGPDVLEERTDHVRGGCRAAGARVDEVAGDAGAPGPPGGQPQELGGDGRRRGAGTRVAGGGLDECADQS